MSKSENSIRRILFFSGVYPAAVLLAILLLGELVAIVLLYHQSISFDTAIADLVMCDFASFMRNQRNTPGNVAWVSQVMEQEYHDKNVLLFGTIAVYSVLTGVGFFLLWLGGNRLVKKFSLPFVEMKERINRWQQEQFRIMPPPEQPDKDEITHLEYNFSELTVELNDRMEKLAAASKLNVHYNKEIAIARNIRDSLLPPGNKLKIDELELEGFVPPSGFGDFFDFHRIAADRVAVFVAGSEAQTVAASLQIAQSSCLFDQTGNCTTATELGQKLLAAVKSDAAMNNVQLKLCIAVIIHTTNELELAYWPQFPQGEPTFGRKKLKPGECVMISTHGLGANSNGAVVKLCYNGNAQGEAK